MPSSSRSQAIYQVLDNGQAKSALKLCNSALQKESGNVLVAALKSVALQRLHRRDEALALCSRILDSKTDDIEVLDLIIWVYRTCMLENNALEVMEYRFKLLVSTDVHSVEMLFDSCLRCEEYAKAQQLSLRLFKTTNNYRYLRWNIVCLMMQLDSLEGKEHSKIVNLAELMAQKLPVLSDDNKETGEQSSWRQNYNQLLLLIWLKRAKHNFSGALDLVAQFSSLFVNHDEMSAMKVQLLVDMRDYNSALEVVKEILADTSKNGIVSATWVMEYANLSNSCGVDAEFHSMKNKKYDDREQNRLLLLADLHKQFHMLLDLHPSVCSEKIAAAQVDAERFSHEIVGYWSAHGCRRSCFEELRCYLSILTPAQAQTVVKEIRDYTKDISKSIEEVRKYISRAKIIHSLRWSECAKKQTEMLQDCNVWINLYCELRLKGMGGGNDHFLEDLLLLIAMTLIEIDECEGKAPETRRFFYVKALSVLEYIQLVCPEHAASKGLLLFLYAKLGVGEGIKHWQKALQIRYHQNEVLSYMWLNGFTTAGLWDNAIEACAIIKGNESESIRHLREETFQVFQHETYCNVAEFVESIRCRSISLPIASANTRQLLLRLLTQTSSNYSLSEGDAHYLEKLQEDRLHLIDTSDREVYLRNFFLCRMPSSALGHLLYPSGQRLIAPASLPRPARCIASLAKEAASSGSDPRSDSCAFTRLWKRMPEESSRFCKLLGSLILAYDHLMKQKCDSILKLAERVKDNCAYLQERRRKVRQESSCALLPLPWGGGCDCPSDDSSISAAESAILYSCDFLSIAVDVFFLAQATATGNDIDLVVLNVKILALKEVTQDPVSVFSSISAVSVDPKTISWWSSPAGHNLSSFVIYSLTLVSWLYPSVVQWMSKVTKGDSPHDKTACRASCKELMTATNNLLCTVQDKLRGMQSDLSSGSQEETESLVKMDMLIPANAAQAELFKISFLSVISRMAQSRHKSIDSAINILDRFRKHLKSVKFKS